MNRHQIEGNWKQLKGHAKERWGELTDNDLTETGGRRERLVGKIQERYGKTEAAASKEVDEFFDELEHRIAHT